MIESEDIRRRRLMADLFEINGVQRTKLLEGFDGAQIQRVLALLEEREREIIEGCNSA